LTKPIISSSRAISSVAKFMKVTIWPTVASPPACSQAPSVKIASSVKVAAARAPTQPKIPTAAEAGYPALTIDGLVGLFGPPGMPLALRQRIDSPRGLPRSVETWRMERVADAGKIVADRLSITEETVKAHVKNILSKLDANDRTHAVTIGLKRGIIELDLHQKDLPQK